jgi:hypothetical protein
MNIADFILAAIAAWALCAIATATEDAADELARIRHLLEEDETDDQTTN